MDEIFWFHFPRVYHVGNENSMEFLIFNRNTILGFRVYHGIPEICQPTVGCPKTNGLGWYVDNLLNKLKHVGLTHHSSERYLY